jgi:hypothetical protein
MAAPLGPAYTLDGRLDDALPLLTWAVKQTTATEMAGTQGCCRVPLGEAQMLAGRLREAHALAERALAPAREHQERGHEAYTLLLLGGFPLPRASGTERRATGALESPSGHERIQLDDVDVEDLTQMSGEDGFTGPTGANHKNFLHVLPRLGAGHEHPGIRRHISTGRAHRAGLPQLIP